MRFFLSPETMRGFRIGLLKLTHFPHVSLIRAYEAISPKVARHFRMATSTGYEDTTKNAKIPQPQKLIGSPLRRLNTRLPLDGRGRPEHLRTSNMKRRTRPTAHLQASGSQDMLLLQSKIDRLSQQVERLLTQKSTEGGTSGTS